MSNPLLTFKTLPPFSTVRAEHLVPAVQQAIDAGRQKVTMVLAGGPDFTWETLCQPLEEAEDWLACVWSPIRHLHAVSNNPEWRAPYQTCLQLLTEYHTWLGQHRELYGAYYQLQASSRFDQLNAVQRKAVENTLRDFKLSGIDLPAAQQQRYAAIAERLTQLSSQFDDNVLDATMGWHKRIIDESQLAGMPPNAVAAARASAEKHGQQGWRLTLEFPSYQAVMTYCDDRTLRQELYHAYHTRASDLGPQGGQWDNSAIMEEILALRHEKARLLGFPTYAELSLATKMAESPEQIRAFLDDLVRRVYSQGERELAELGEFVRQHFEIDPLQPWDLPYYSEKLKQQRHAINDEQLRPYFPEPRVLEGLFELLQRLFAITVRERQGVDTWHPEVRFYDLFCDQDQEQPLGSLYLDLYARSHKNSGAWMDECCIARRDSQGAWQQPVAYLTCNFNRPVGEQPALFTHEEVITLFHEFGHCLHHLLSKVEVAAVSGTHVPWDAVEVPSQFLENWCWQPEALAFISGHYQTAKPLPSAMLNQLLAAKNFQEGLFILRQLEFSLFDLRLHHEYQPTKGACILEKLAEVKEAVAVVALPDWLRTPHTFSHIFSGGYAVGYYGYLWAEVLSADAFNRFEEEGIFNRQVGQEFVDAVLSRGGSEEPLVLFKRFRGREPQQAAFLRHHGISQ